MSSTIKQSIIHGPCSCVLVSVVVNGQQRARTRLVYTHCIVFPLSTHRSSPWCQWWVMQPLSMLWHATQAHDLYTPGSAHWKSPCGVPVHPWASCLTMGSQMVLHLCYLLPLHRFSMHTQVRGGILSIGIAQQAHVAEHISEPW
jgi:hypothetical protein